VKTQTEIAQEAIKELNAKKETASQQVQITYVIEKIEQAIAAARVMISQEICFKRYFYFYFLFLLLSCSSQIKDAVTVIPKVFKINFPYEIRQGGIIISTDWGRDRIKRNLLFDNNSPTWLNQINILNYNSISKSKIFSFNTSASDGNKILGDVYRCDSICIGPITFANVHFYTIKNKNLSKKEIEGAIGEDLISKGVWKINFKDKNLTFASTIDSIQMEHALKIASKFTTEGIKIPVTFRNHESRDMLLDLGFNLFILLPSSEFAKIEKNNTRSYTDTLQFSTPAHTQIVKSLHAFDSIQIGNTYYKSIVTTNEVVTESLLGYMFFQ
jgi:hypothetical protein